MVRTCVAWRKAKRNAERGGINGEKRVKGKVEEERGVNDASAPTDCHSRSRNAT